MGMTLVLPQRHQRGLTLLEVLIALSIFALIGVASFRVLSSVIDTQQTGDRHSQELATFQKALSIIDADLQQLINRNVRVSTDEEQVFLTVNQEDYPLQLTRGGWRNPLQLARSSMLRVAYDVGPHPQVNNEKSLFYQDDRSFLRRHYWTVLDRTIEATPRIQALLPDVEAFTIAVLSDAGRHLQWPLAETQNPNQNVNTPAAAVELLGIELSFDYLPLGILSRLYKVN